MNRTALSFAIFLFASIFLFVGSIPATEPLYQNSFEEEDRIAPLFQRFKSMAVRDGVLEVEHERGHAASPTLPISFTDGMFRFRFKLNGAERLVCRFEETSRIENAHAHLCRLTITPTKIALQLDRPPKDPNRRDERLFASKEANLADGRWHDVEIRFSGKSLHVDIDHRLQMEGVHKDLSNKKLGVIFVVQRGIVLLDDFLLVADETEIRDQSASEVKSNMVRGLEIFAETIEPMFKQHCYECHSHEFEEASGGLVVDSRPAMLRGGDLGPSLVPGSPDQSLLLKALLYEDAALQMPPDGKLGNEVLASVRRWIELGAPDPRKSIAKIQPVNRGPDASQLWSVQRLDHSTTPATSDSRWPRGNIDQYVLQQLKLDGLSPSPDASPAELVRRLHFVLTGIPPTIEESTSFFERAKLDLERALAERVDELLSRQQFGERWGRHWLDVARYSDTSGTTAPRPFQEAWRYRDYVIDAFNSDKPWSDFVREQIAGDLIQTGSTVERSRNLVATGYLALSHVLAATRDPETLKLDTIDEQLDVVGKTFLGISIGCARCHDHKLDPFPTRDYYSMAGIFRSTMSYKPSVSQESLTLDGAELHANAIDAPAWLRGGKGVRIHSVKDIAQPRDEPIHLRGEVEITGEIVPRGLPTLLSSITSPMTSSKESGRRQLASWVLDRNNALTWRVIVNRIWHHAFGKGLVRSTDNFGFTGDRPSHPELLDHLVVQFRDRHKGSFKSLLRELLLSRTWRQSSRLRSDAFEVDPENRKLWRANPRRMEAEAVIDSIQHVCGSLDLTAPSKANVPTFKVGNQGSTSALEIPKTTLRRRAIYWPVFRKDVPIAMDLLGIFDFPSATAPRGTREVTHVPSQSLALLNNPFVIQNARSLQNQLLDHQRRIDDRGRLQLLFRKLYARPPTLAEETCCLDFLEQFAQDLKESGSARTTAIKGVCWNRLCHTLLVSNEFIVIP